MQDRTQACPRFATLVLMVIETCQAYRNQALLMLVCVFVATAMLAANAAQAEPPPQRLWIRQWDGPNHHSDEPRAILTLADHSVMVAAAAYDPTVGGPHPALLRYDSAGKLQCAIVEPG